MIDQGEKDDKIIAVHEDDPEFNVCCHTLDECDVCMAYFSYDGCRNSIFVISPSYQSIVYKRSTVSSKITRRTKRNKLKSMKNSKVHASTRSSYVSILMAMIYNEIDHRAAIAAVEASIDLYRRTYTRTADGKIISKL
jgi:hypothetical protein